VALRGGGFWPVEYWATGIAPAQRVEPDAKAMTRTIALFAKPIYEIWGISPIPRYQCNEFLVLGRHGKGSADLPPALLLMGDPMLLEIWDLRLIRELAQIHQTTRFRCQRPVLDALAGTMVYRLYVLHGRLLAQACVTLRREEASSCRRHFLIARS